MPQKVSLASDNWTPAHPAIMEAIVQANEGSAFPYGSDPWTEEAHNLIQSIFQKKCKILILPTGTGSNVLALKLSCRRHESVICTDIAHIQSQESGAAEAVVGCKLITIPHQNGKLKPEAVLKRLNSKRALGKHTTSPRVLSITQPTEIGTVYTLEELIALSKLCRTENLLFHIDGSRFYNAAAFLKIDLGEMIHSIEVDLLSLGGTKNGLMGAESLIIFNPTLEEGSDHLHKQTLQLLSKMRYLSAQYIPFFKQGLWRTLANQANQRAQELTSILKNTPHISLSYPVETNQIFFTVPPSWIPLIQDKISCYLWDHDKSEIRWIASWNTSEEDIKQVELAIAEISLNPIYTETS